jgi:hypothetical protein
VLLYIIDSEEHMMTDMSKVIDIVEAAYVYIPFDSEALRINHIDREEGVFYSTGEESGDDIVVNFEDVDLERDMFYKLVLMDS